MRQSISHYKLFFVTFLFILFQNFSDSAEIKNRKMITSEKQYSLLKKNPKSEERLQWWRDARFGIFVHWGVYSMLGGEYKGADYGKEMGGPAAEWIFKTAKIPENEYRKFASTWNPQNYNPEQWCKLAASSGAKYIVLTAKHHDGLALFDSEIDNWNILQSTAYKKDIVRQFADAARKYNLKVGLYYSHRLDWFRLGTNRNAELTDKYKKVLENHLKTIFIKYKPDLIWFDMGKSGLIADLAFKITKKFAPNCIICGRIGGDYGDYKCMKDRHLPPPNNTMNAETPMTMRLNWGFDKDDENWKLPNDIIKMLSICATRNTNLLLNIGPDGNGKITENEINILNSVGAWMKVNSEAIYNTRGTPFNGEFPWGSLTVNNNNCAFFIHIHQKPVDGIIVIPGISSPVSNVNLLAKKHNLHCSFSLKKNTLTVKLPDTPLDTVRIIKVSGNKPFLFENSSGPDVGQKMNNIPDTRIISARTGVIQKFSNKNNGTLTIIRKSGIKFKVINVKKALIVYKNGNKGNVSDLTAGKSVKVTVEFPKRKKTATFQTKILIKKALPFLKNGNAL